MDKKIFLEVLQTEFEKVSENLLKAKDKLSGEYGFTNYINWVFDDIVELEYVSSFLKRIIEGLENPTDSMPDDEKYLESLFLEIFKNAWTYRRENSSNPISNEVMEAKQKGTKYLIRVLAKAAEKANYNVHIVVDTNFLLW